MKRRFEGLQQADRSSGDLIPDGIYLVQVKRCEYRRQTHKHYYSIRFVVLEPIAWRGREIRGCLYCGSRALWKLSWFLHDFGYDAELLGHSEVEENAISGLRGVLKISHTILNGVSLQKLEGFAPVTQWDEFRSVCLEAPAAREGGS
jgi:hypothetical protein